MVDREFTNINGIKVCDQTARNSIPTKTSQLTNDSDYVTTTQVNQAIDNAQLGGGEVDLSGYVTKGVGNASQIQFADGQTFQDKLDAGTLKGNKGDKGDKGDPGEQGPQGEVGPQGPQGPAGSTEANGVSIIDAGNNFTATNVEGALAELFQSVSNGKSLIASAITDKGVTTSNTATFETMSNNIKLIEGGAVETSSYETINGQLYRVILNEDFKTKDYLDANIFADCYGITSWADNPGKCRANYKIEDGLLKLIIDNNAQLWAPDSSNKASSISTGKRNGLHPNTTDRSNLYYGKTPYRSYTEKFLGHIMQYGRVEIKCKIPYGNHNMCAFWLLGIQDNIEQSAEIDVFETSTGRSATTTIGTLHTWYDKSIGTGSNVYSTYEYDVDSDMSANFHTYAVEWDETGVELYVDGVKKIGKDRIGWNKNIAYPMMILLDHYQTTVESPGWGTNGGVATLPCSFDIEYIKAYKKAASEETLLSIISQDECSFTITEYSDDLINADYEIKGMPSYVSLNWNDGVKSEHWVKWEPITDDMKEQFKTAGAYTLTGIIPGINFQPTMTLTVENNQGSSADYIAELTPDENGLLIDFDFTNLASGTEYVTSKNNSLLKAKVIGGTCETDGIQLDGVDDYIELRCKPFVNKDIEDMTVIIEFTADDTQDGLDTFFECCNNAEPYGGIQCRWTGTAMGWHFATGHTPYNTAEMSNSTSNVFGNTPTTVPKTSVKMTRSSSGELKFTMDDTVTKSCTNPNIVAKPFIWDGLFYIGCNMQVNGVPRRFAKMKVKSIKMYNKVV